LTYATDRLLVTGVALPGDVNLDGTVNAMDFNVIATDFGIPGGANWLQGDLSGDGVVNSTDFMILATHFGQSLPMPSLPAPIGAIVPEPASAIPTLSLLCALRRRQRASRKKPCQGGSSQPMAVEMAWRANCSGISSIS
jgi:hypothetical protein